MCPRAEKGHIAHRIIRAQRRPLRGSRHGKRGKRVEQLQTLQQIKETAAPTQQQHQLGTQTLGIADAVGEAAE
ncbi:hypothetical protein A7P94_03300 [Eikenella sp. NML01-A-086]|nr:hypothetical protein A7P94_03300 [Eikenella sp. NML01-A-086]OAM41954.1 hypothetical protein A7Q02_04495 [Eikenella sp. NML97-A-109]